MPGAQLAGHNRGTWSPQPEGAGQATRHPFHSSQADGRAQPATSWVAQGVSTLAT